MININQTNGNTLKEVSQFKCKKCGNISASPSIKCSRCFASHSQEQIIHERKELPAPVSEANRKRFSTGFKNVDLLLDEGMETGRVIFVTASQGIGKSTFVSQISAHQIKNLLKVYLFTGEETASQIVKRAMRLGIQDLQPVIFYDKDITQLCEIVQANPPDILLVDSIQALLSSLGQRLTNNELASIMLRIRKITTSFNIATWVIGHLRKDGKYAGPATLAFMCDVHIEAKKGNNGEVIFTTPEKNRLGATGNRAVFRMTQQGLVEKDEIETGYFLRYSLPAIKGLASFVSKFSNEFSTDELTITKTSKEGLFVNGINSKHALFLTTVIKEHFPNFQPSVL